MEQGEVQSFLIIFTIVALCMGVAVVVLFVLFQRRKNRLLLRQAQERRDYEKGLAETQIEIREETLRNISWELHDNIGQLMTLAKLQLQSQNGSLDSSGAEETISRAIQELRVLSRLINPEALKNLNLAEALQLEIERFNRLQFLEADLTVEGTPISIDPRNETIIFRILQEFFSNTIKHSRATHLFVGLEYTDKIISINADDNGVGFDADSAFSGIGIKNMKSRAKLIGAKLDFYSEKDKGTSLQLTYHMDIKNKIRA
ncbi:MAG: sensor histidine kinase [Flavobacteriaceae bacterium]